MELRSLSRGLQIIELFSYQRPVLGFSEISHHCRFPKSTLYRFLENLTRRGFLKVNPATKEYRLGALFIQLGQIAQKGVPLMEVCQPAMRRLSAEIGHSVYLSVPEGGQKVCLSCVEGRSTPIKYAPAPGSVAPLHAGASGKVLLAFSPEEEMAYLAEKGRLLSVTPKTITHKEELRARLRQIRKNGYDYSEGELVPGTWALAFPILDPRGSAFASVTVAGTLLNPPGPGLKKLVEKVKSEVFHIENELWRNEGPKGAKPPARILKKKS
ncbi:MAG: IclR family transcriptional regulator [Deltaproteobacteria bacterium]|nr:IclR family transcriptional regulator [Deltaproteobacteria bacterium]